MKCRVEKNINIGCKFLISKARALRSTRRSETLRRAGGKIIVLNINRLQKRWSEAGDSALNNKQEYRMLGAVARQIK